MQQDMVFYIVGAVSGACLVFAIVCGLCNLYRDMRTREDEEKRRLIDKPEAPRRRRSRTASMLATNPTEYNTKLNASGFIAVPVENPDVEAIRAQTRDFFGVSPSDVAAPSSFYSRSLLQNVPAECADGGLPIPQTPDWRTEAVISMNQPCSLTSGGSFDEAKIAAMRSAAALGRSGSMDNGTASPDASEAPAGRDVHAPQAPQARHPLLADGGFLSSPAECSPLARADDGAVA